MEAQRPLGVTIISILIMLGSILGIFAGIAAIVIGSISIAILPSMTGLSLLIGLVTIVISVIQLVGVYWLWKMLKKGWTIIMIMQIVGIITSAATLNLLSIVISIIIVGYLWTKRSAFT